MILLMVILLTVHGANAIYGGSYPDTSNSQFVVEIWSNLERKCSGFIIDIAHIITAGHCVTEERTSLSVAAGVHKPQNMQVIPVKSVHFHPDFRAVCFWNNVYWENDIAVVKLSESFTWGGTIRAVKLIDKGYTWGLSESYLLYGWAETTVNDVDLLRLEWCYATVMENEECRDLNVDLLKNEGCLRRTVQSIVLNEGDHGAPVTAAGIATGITVRGGGHESSPPVILSIYPYLDFIASILNVRDINMPGIFPHYVVILHDGRHHCGGSIIDSTHILTAAHCFDDIPSENFAVLSGYSEFLMNRVPGWEIVLVHRIQNHPHYENTIQPGKGLAVTHDIAVLTLASPLTWSATISPIGLADSPPTWKTCTLYRWSRTTTPQGERLTKSLWSSVPINDYDTCRTLKPSIGSTQLCVLNPFSLPIAAKGDSGSPIVCDGMLIVGVLSTWATLDRRAQGPIEGYFYTSILPYRDFITHAIAN